MRTRREKLNYLAGFIDGEGCLLLRRNSKGYTPVVSASQKDPTPLQWICKEFGGKVRQPGRVRSQWRWSVHSQAALDLLAELEPFLILKKLQAQQLLKLKLRGGPGEKRNLNYTLMEERKQIKEELEALRK